jgi:hypothetical protein
MATRLMLAADSALNTRAAMPGVPAMPRPTTATVDIPGSTCTLLTSRRAISAANARSRCSLAARASFSGTVKQIDCSLDDWVMSDTDIPCSESVANVRAATPGTPMRPRPSTVTSAWAEMAESAFTGYSSSVWRDDISVPAWAGSPNGRT